MRTDLTPAEQEVFNAWKRGEKQKDTALRLNKSIGTVKVQRQAIKQKLRLQAVDREFTPIEQLFVWHANLIRQIGDGLGVQDPNDILLLVEIDARLRRN